MKEKTESNDQRLQKFKNGTPGRSKVQEHFCLLLCVQAGSSPSSKVATPQQPTDVIQVLLLHSSRYLSGRKYKATSLLQVYLYADPSSIDNHTRSQP